MEPKRKRRNATGCLRQKPGSGAWYLYYYDETGKYKGVSLQTKNLAIAEKRRTEIMNAVKASGSTTTDTSLDAYLAAHPALSPVSITRYKRTWARWIKLGDAMFDELKSPYAIQNTAASVKCLLKWFHDHDQHLDMKIPEQTKALYPKRKQIPTMEHFHKLLNNAVNQPTLIMIALCGYAGLRGTEAGNLLWSEVNLETDLLTIQGHSANSRLGIQFSRTKSGRMRRVSICVPLKWILIHIRDTTPHADTDYVIQHPHDVIRYPYARGINEIKQTAIKAGINIPITRHLLRHFYARTLIRSGVATLYDIKLALGHAKLDTTERMYMDDDDSEYNKRLNVFPNWIPENMREPEDEPLTQEYLDSVNAEHAEWDRKHHPFD